MRFAFLSICLTLICFSCYSQNNQTVYKYKAFETSVIRKDAPPGQEVNWTPTDILVVINIDKNKIDTYGKKIVHMDIVKAYPVSTMDNGDDILKMDVVDDEGNQLKAQIIVFKNSENLNHVATLQVTYSDMDLFFRLKKND